MKVGSAEIHTWSLHRRVPSQTAPPAFSTVHLIVVFSPEKFSGNASIVITRRSAGKVATVVATVRPLFVSFVSGWVGRGAVSVSTVT